MDINSRDPNDLGKVLHLALKSHLSSKRYLQIWMEQLRKISKLLMVFFQSSQDKKGNNKSRQQQVIYQEVQTPANSTA